MEETLPAHDSFEDEEDDFDEYDRPLERWAPLGAALPDLEGEHRYCVTYSQIRLSDGSGIVIHPCICFH